MDPINKLPETITINQTKDLIKEIYREITAHDNDFRICFHKKVLIIKALRNVFGTTLQCSSDFVDEAIAE